MSKPFAFANSISENILSMRKPLTTRILLQARGWLVGKVSLGRNGPIRITSFESSRCRSESSTFGFEALSRPDAVGYGFGYQ